LAIGPMVDHSRLLSVSGHRSDFLSYGGETVAGECYRFR
jgi:hypothetical protein